MKRLTVVIFAMIGGFGLFACSKTHPLNAVFIDGHLAFDSDDKPPEGAPYCPDWVTVTEEGGRVMWSIDAYDVYRHADRCGPIFPLAYGKAPNGAKIQTPPKPLEPGHRYHVSIIAGDSYEGVFRYTVKTVRSLDNLDIHGLDAEAVIASIQPQSANEMTPLEH